LRLLGWAFEFFGFLMKKFDFKYKIIIPDYNIVGGSNDSDGSLMQLMVKEVMKIRKNQANTENFHSQKADVAVAFIPMLADLLRYPSSVPLNWVSIN
jgi:hypothetical protein